MFLVKDPIVGLVEHVAGPDIIDIEIRYSDDLVAVTVSGELDVSNAAWLDDTLHHAIENGAAEVIVDLAALTFMDSAGLSVLEDAHTRLHVSGGTLSILNPTPRVARLLEITGLLSLLSIPQLRKNRATRNDAS